MSNSMSNFATLMLAGLLSSVLATCSCGIARSKFWELVSRKADGVCNVGDLVAYLLRCPFAGCSLSLRLCKLGATYKRQNREHESVFGSRPGGLSRGECVCLCTLSASAAKVLQDTKGGGPHIVNTVRVDLYTGFQRAASLLEVRARVLIAGSKEIAGHHRNHLLAPASCVECTTTHVDV